MGQAFVFFTARNKITVFIAYFTALLLFKARDLKYTGW
jgi:hypothetical protein